MGFTWDTISDAEVDADSPLNAPLFSKIQGNQNALALHSVIFSAGKAECVGQVAAEENVASMTILDNDTYTNGTVLTFDGVLYVPEWADDIICALYHKFSTGSYSEKLARFSIDDDAAGWDNGSEVIPPQSNYGGQRSTVTGVTNPGRWANFRIQAKQTSGGSEIYSLRALAIKDSGVVT